MSGNGLHSSNMSTRDIKIEKWLNGNILYLQKTSLNIWTGGGDEHHRVDS